MTLKQAIAKAKTGVDLFPSTAATVGLGADEGGKWLTDWMEEVAKPPRHIHLSSFRYLRRPVSRGDYARISMLRVLDGEGESNVLPKGWDSLAEGLVPGLAHLPVLHVTWDQAEDFCELLGGHLPSEIQWEVLARRWMAEISEAHGDVIWERLTERLHDLGSLDRFGEYGPGRECFVGEFEDQELSKIRSQERFYVGAMGEWCLDHFYEALYKDMAEQDPLAEDPKLLYGPVFGFRTIRGLASTGARGAVVSRFAWPADEGHNAGFRCVWTEAP